MLIHGRCHCGNLGFELRWDGDPDQIPARACGCAFCTRHGGVWTSHPRAALAIAIRNPELVSRYAFGTRTATFHVCARCGAVPFVTSDIDGATYAVVNVNAFEDFPASRLRRAPADFEGEELDARLARRKRNWIAQVRVAEHGGGEPPRAC